MGLLTILVNFVNILHHYKNLVKKTRGHLVNFRNGAKI